MLREGLGLHQKYKKVKIASLILLLALVAYILAIVLIEPDNSTYDNSD